MTYLKMDKPRPVVLFEVAKAMATGTRPELGEERHVSSELRSLPQDTGVGPRPDSRSRG